MTNDQLLDIAAAINRDLKRQRNAHPEPEAFLPQPRFPGTRQRRRLSEEEFLRVGAGLPLPPKVPEHVRRQREEAIHLDYLRAVFGPQDGDIDHQGKATYERLTFPSYVF